MRSQVADIGPIKEVVAALRTGYSLTYRPKSGDVASWHPLKVLVKGSRDGVIAKPGYFVR